MAYSETILDLGSTTFASFTDFLLRHRSSDYLSSGRSDTEVRLHNIYSGYEVIFRLDGTRVHIEYPNMYAQTDFRRIIDSINEHIESSKLFNITFQLEREPVEADVDYINEHYVFASTKSKPQELADEKQIFELKTSFGVVRIELDTNAKRIVLQATSDMLQIKGFLKREREWDTVDKRYVVKKTDQVQRVHVALNEARYLQVAAPKANVSDAPTIRINFIKRLGRMPTDADTSAFATMFLIPKGFSLVSSDAAGKTYEKSWQRVELSTSGKHFRISSPDQLLLGELNSKLPEFIASLSGGSISVPRPTTLDATITILEARMHLTRPVNQHLTIHGEVCTLDLNGDVAKFLKATVGDVQLINVGYARRTVHRTEKQMVDHSESYIRVLGTLGIPESYCPKCNGPAYTCVAPSPREIEVKSEANQEVTLTFKIKGQPITITYQEKTVVNESGVQQTYLDARMQFTVKGPKDIINPIANHPDVEQILAGLNTNVSSATASTDGKRGRIATTRFKNGDTNYVPRGKPVPDPSRPPPSGDHFSSPSGSLLFRDSLLRANALPGMRRGRSR